MLINFNREVSNMVLKQFNLFLEFLCELADHAFKLFASAVLIHTLFALMAPVRPSGYIIMLSVLMLVLLLGLFAKPIIWIAKLKDDTSKDLSSINNNRCRYAEFAAKALSIVLLAINVFVVSYTFKTVLTHL